MLSKSLGVESRRGEALMGTLVNAIAVVIGGLFGLRFRSILSKQVEQAMFQMVGMSVALIGLVGVLQSMLVVNGESGRLESQGALLLLLSLVIGMVLGELFRIEERIDRIGQTMERTFHKQGFATGFISASLIFCIGAMAIIGALNDGILHDPSILYTKSAIDAITSIVLASTLGYGVLFAGVSVLIYQGSLTLLAGMVAPILEDVLLNDICMIGYVIVLAIGLNFLGFIKIKTANLLPALLVPIVIALLQSLWNLF